MRKANPMRSQLRFNSWFSMTVTVTLGISVLPYLSLLLWSMGNGWTFPNVLPDRIDGAGWRTFFSDRAVVRRGVMTSLMVCIPVATAGTLGGLLIGRLLARQRSRVWTFVTYLPFVMSPVVVGVCWQDLMIRLQLASTLTGVMLVQTVFAITFAGVLFGELWDQKIERCVALVTMLGGNRRQVWQQAVWPQVRGLAVVCWLQAAMFSWLDYGLVSVIGGGRVTSLTMLVFSFLRQGNLSRAAQSGLVLMAPAVIAMLAAVLLLRQRDRPS